MQMKNINRMKKVFKSDRKESIWGKIIVNKICCKKCGDIIESKTVHDFKFCKCKSVAVDGGHCYLRRIGNREDFEDLSEVLDNGRE